MAPPTVDEEEQSHSPHIIIFPSPGMGHLIPLINFATHLLHRFPHLSLTFIVPSSSPPTPPQLSALAALPSSVTSILLDPVSLSDLPSTLSIESIISYTIIRSLSGLRDSMRIEDENGNNAKKMVDGLVVDLFGTDAMDVAAEFGVRSYVFYPTTAMCLSLFRILSEMDETVECEYRDMTEPVRLEGCVPVHGRDLLDPVQDRSNEAYKWVLHHARRYELAEGIMVNTFEALEGGALGGLRDWPPVYAVGPLVQGVGRIEERGKECVTWLDGQIPGSVLFVSFGSGGTLSWDQINELALGLEMSQQRFLWVARSPNNGTRSATFFNAGSLTDPLGFLPEGFVERTRGRGLVVSSWAPQIHVLAHGSTGGFLTHCGWNSTLESVVHGVPLIAWPLYAEQKMNAVMLVDGLKVALRPRVGGEGLIGREEIARVARALMEGEEGKDLRARMRDLKYAAAKAISDDGSSTKALDEVVKKWTLSHAR